VINQYEHGAHRPADRNDLMLNSSTPRSSR
jgi:hypothetical protein